MYSNPAWLTVLLFLAAHSSRAVADPSVSVGDMLAQAMAGLTAGDSAASASAASSASSSGDQSVMQKLALAMVSVDLAGGAAKDGGSPRDTPQLDTARSLLTLEIKQKLLDEHNRLRAQIARGQVEGLPCGANMALMEWDDRLAATANDWAGLCSAKPDSPANRAVPGLTCVTQNWATGWLREVKSLVGEWFDQRANWDAAAGACRPDKRCDEFRRLASASARFLGCALQDCNRATGFAVLLVCNYAGGDSRASVPYAPGPACRACPASADQCMLGLCACRGLCEAAAAGGASACTDAPCYDNADCSGQQLASSFCRNVAAVSQCPKLCSACGGPLTDGIYKPRNSANIVARVIV